MRPCLYVPARFPPLRLCQRPESPPHLPCPDHARILPPSIFRRQGHSLVRPTATLAARPKAAHLTLSAVLAAIEVLLICMICHIPIRFTQSG